MLPSYDKNRKVNDSKSKDCFDVSVTQKQTTKETSKHREELKTKKAWNPLAWHVPSE